MRTHYGPWQPCWISNQHQKHKSGREPSSEHFWQVWLKSVQRFQRRRFKCEKLTDGRLPMKKAVVICLIIPTIFPFDAGSRVDNVHHTSGYFFMLDPASKGNVVGMIRQMTTTF
jgi:hypothetical protein